MSDVTQADRERAQEIRQEFFTLAETPRGFEERIAAVLAEERAKARAPFLALAEEFDRNLDFRGRLTDAIRRAAEED